MKINSNLLIFSISLLQLSCSDFNKMAPLLVCESNEELNVICEFTNPEDIVVTPDNNFLIVSEYGGQKPIQKEKSGLPEKNKILIENFPYDNGEYLFFHTFLLISGRLSNSC